MLFEDIKVIPVKVVQIIPKLIEDGINFWNLKFI